MNNLSQCPYKCDKLQELRKLVSYEMFEEFRVCPFHEYPIEDVNRK
jgi:hypothetical protein